MIHRQTHHRARTAGPFVFKCSRTQHRLNEAFGMAIKHERNFSSCISDRNMSLRFSIQINIANDSNKAPLNEHESSLTNHQSQSMDDNRHCSFRLSRSVLERCVIQRSSVDIFLCFLVSTMHDKRCT
jgi:sucrose-6-phosphate hydrolase SacC (GH32 family)